MKPVFMPHQLKSAVIEQDNRNIWVNYYDNLSKHLDKPYKDEILIEMASFKDVVNKFNNELKIVVDSV